MRLHVLVASCLLALGPRADLVGAEPAPRPTGTLTLETLTTRMATSSGVVASFREVKELALLDAPIESRGMLYFVPPDRLLRHTTSPDDARLVVEEGRVRYRDAAGSEEIDLAENPVARQFVDNLTVRRFIEQITLAGDGPALHTLVTNEADGDRTTTTFEHVDTNHRFTAEELQRLFHAPQDHPTP